MARLISSLLLSLLIGSSASAVAMEWTFVGNPGNPCDPYPTGFGRTDCFGAVGYAYQIGTYEVTNAQYAEFLNAKAASDPLALYNTNMGVWGITRTGSSGSYSYSVSAGRENRPVNEVTFYDAIRFANWMNNGQGSGDTETGSYTLLGGMPTPSNGTTLTRNAGATIVLTSEDEWFKAAYFSPSAGSYFDYPAGSDTPTTCSLPTATPNRANCGQLVFDLMPKGSYTGSASPYGTFDQGGNVWEWNEATILAGERRGLRGGSFEDEDVLALAASTRVFLGVAGNYDRGFRLAMIPEPGTGLLVIAGLLGLAGWRTGLVQRTSR